MSFQQRKFNNKTTKWLKKFLYFAFVLCIIGKKKSQCPLGHNISPANGKITFFSKVHNKGRKKIFI